MEVGRFREHLGAALLVVAALVGSFGLGKPLWAAEPLTQSEMRETTGGSGNPVKCDGSYSWTCRGCLRMDEEWYLLDIEGGGQVRRCKAGAQNDHCDTFWMLCGWGVGPCYDYPDHCDFCYQINQKISSNTCTNPT